MSDLVIKDGGLYKTDRGYLLHYKGRIYLTGLSESLIHMPGSEYDHHISWNDLKYLCQIKDLVGIDHWDIGDYDEEDVIDFSNTSTTNIDIYGFYIKKGTNKVRSRVKTRLLALLLEVEKTIEIGQDKAKEIKQKLSGLENKND